MVTVFFPDHYETERRTDLDDDRHHLFQTSLRLRGDASVVGVQHGPKHPLGCILGQITPCNHTHKIVQNRLVDGETAERHRQQRYEEDVEQVRGDHTTLAEALLDGKPL